MKALLSISAALTLVSSAAAGTNLLINGNLDRTQATEIVPGFFLPKPSNWVNEGFRTITGPYEDEMSSEPWAGPAPTPVTTDGNLNPPHPEGCGGPDCAVFFKGFSGNQTNGSATGHLYQDVTASAGVEYTLTGWAGAEANFFGNAEFALEFLNAGGTEIAESVLDITAQILTPNGNPFNYQQFTITALAPAGTAFVRARASMIEAVGNPAGGGQAYVVDDFTLTPEPTSAIGMALLGVAGLLRRR